MPDQNADHRADLAQIVYRVNSPMYGDYDTHEDTADAILAAGWRPPLPDSETEWGWRYVVDPEDVRVAKNEAEARWRVSKRITPSEVVKRRAAGPWEVTS